MPKFVVFFLLFLFCGLYSSSGHANDFEDNVIGIIGMTMIHEGGHAVTAKYFGTEVLQFRPYPHLAKYQQLDGTVKKKWVGGIVRYKSFSGPEAVRKRLWTSAMGSGTTALSVLFLSPLIPEISSRGGREALDAITYYSALDWPLYILWEYIDPEFQGDWRRVSDLTGVGLHWYLLGALLTSYALNEYRNHWRRKAYPGERIDSFSFGVSTSF